jgi:hypothetical protein
MRKIITITLVFFMVFNLSAQRGLDWINIDNTKDDYLFRYFYKYSDGVYQAIFTIPEIKPFQPIKNQIFIRTYNADMSKYKEQGIPSESPYELSVTGFKDYTVIFGSTDENKNPFLHYHKDNKLVITDAQLNPLINVSFPVHGKKNRFEGLPSAYNSHDSSHLILTNHEILESESKPFRETPVMHYINIYDERLTLKWCDSVNFANIFDKDTPINHYSIDFIRGKVYMIATTNGNTMKKVKPEIFVIRFDAPGKSSIIARKVCISPQFGWESMVTKEGKLIIAGLNYIENGPVKKTLFFMNIDLNTLGGEAMIKTIAIDKTLLAKYPQYKSILLSDMAEPSILLRMKDGLLYCGEYHLAVTSTSSTGTSSHSSTTYYVNTISFIKYDWDGNIEWIKMIEKNTASKTAFSSYFCRAFLSNGNVVIFYTDYLDNIFSDKFSRKPRIVTDNNLCMAQAIVDNEGNMKKSLIYKIGEDGTRADLNTMRQIDNTRFFVAGTGMKMKTRGSFVAFYDLKE